MLCMTCNVSQRVAQYKIRNTTTLFQQGAGLMEVLIAMLLLSIAVMGFAALQVRSVAATNESIQRTQALILADTLIERAKANSDYSLGGEHSYAVSLSKYYPQVTLGLPNPITAPTSTCAELATCTAEQLADKDAYDLSITAQKSGMNLRLQDCKGMAALPVRQCLFIAWDTTTNAGYGSATTDCMTDQNVYHPTSTCMMMEIFN